MSTQIVNGAPLVNFLGTNDLSRTVQLVPSEQIPQYLPKFYIFSEGGPTNEQLVSGPILSNLYGDRTIAYGSKFYNHQSLFLQDQLKRGSAMVKRVVPTDATKANITIYAAVRSGEGPVYLRNSDGSFLRNVVGDKIEDGGNTQDTLKVTFVAVENGSGSVITMGDVTAYPIVTINAKYEGASYNDIGISLSAVPGLQVTDKFLEGETGYMPINMGLWKKTKSKARKVKNLSAGEYTTGSIYPDTVNPYTSKTAFLGDIFINRNFNTKNEKLPYIVDTIEEPIFHTSAIETLAKRIVTNEMQLVNDTVKTWADGVSLANNTWYDYPVDEPITADMFKLINPFTFKSRSGVEFMGTELDTEGDVDTSTLGVSVNFGVNSPVFMSGGTDGTMTAANFNNLVIDEVNRYTDVYSPLLNMVYHVESTFIDSGFPMDVKYAMMNVLSNRPDVNIIFSTHIEETDRYVKATIGQLSQRADLINLKLRTFPESLYFGTGILRALIIVGNATVADDSYGGYVSQAYNMCNKLNNYMGAGNGNWRAVDRFDVYPGNLVNNLSELYPEDIPDVVKANLYDKGIVWTERMNRSRYHLPAKQTAYTDDTSILNGVLSMFGVCQLTKIGNQAHKRYVGSERLSRTVLAEKIEAFVLSETANKFDSAFNIRPKVTFTSVDLSRKYSYHLDIGIGGRTMITAETLSITAFDADQ